MRGEVRNDMVHIDCSHCFMDSGLSHFVYAGRIHTYSSGNCGYHDSGQNNQGKIELPAKFCFSFPSGCETNSGRGLDSRRSDGRPPCRPPQFSQNREQKLSGR